MHKVASFFQKKLLYQRLLVLKQLKVSVLYPQRATEVALAPPCANQVGLAPQFATQSCLNRTKIDLDVLIRAGLGRAHHPGIKSERQISNKE